VDIASWGACPMARPSPRPGTTPTGSRERSAARPGAQRSDRWKRPCSEARGRWSGCRCATQRPPREPERAVLVPAGVGEAEAGEEVDHPCSSGFECSSRRRSPSAIRRSRRRATVPRACLRETAAVRGTVEALRAAVGWMSPNRAGTPWRRLGTRKSVVRFFCSTAAVVDRTTLPCHVTRASAEVDRSLGPQSTEHPIVQRNPIQDGRQNKG